MKSSDDVKSLQIELVGTIDEEHVPAFKDELGIDDVAIDAMSDDGLESIDPVTAVSVAIGTVDLARRVWQWWKSRSDESVPEIVAKLPGGTEVRFSGSDEQELERFLAYLADRRTADSQP